MYPYPVSGDVGTTPKVTNLFICANFKPISTTDKNFLIFLISWSEDRTNKVGSFSSSRDFNAAKVIAGAVFLPKGSSNIVKSSISNSRICSATINLCSSLHTNIGFFIFSKVEILLIVFCNRLNSSPVFIAKNCFG